MNGSNYCMLYKSWLVTLLSRGLYFEKGCYINNRVEVSVKIANWEGYMFFYANPHVSAFFMLTPSWHSTITTTRDFTPTYKFPCHFQDLYISILLKLLTNVNKTYYTV